MSHPGTPALLDRLAAAGIATRTVAHPPVHTVAESQALRGELPGHHVKNLFLAPAAADAPHRLVTLAEERQVSINALARRLGAGRLRMAPPEALRGLLGVEPGSVTPLALVNAPPGRVRFALDAALLAPPGPVWVHPLHNAASTAIDPADLLRFLEALGHPAELLDLDTPAG